MKIQCPNCSSSYRVADEKLTRPLSRAACKECGAVLQIERESGRVRVEENAPNLPVESPAEPASPTADPLPVLESGLKNQGPPDYLAGGIFAAALILLFILGFLLIRDIPSDGFRKPARAISRLLEDSKRLLIKEPVRTKKSVRPDTSRDNKFLKNFNLGHKLFREKKYDKALQAYSRAIKIDPKNAGAYYWRGRLLITMGEKDRALSDLKASVELNPSNSEAYDNLGWLASQKGLYDDGITYLSQSIRMKPDHAWAYYQRGFCYYKKGDQQQALKDTKKSCDLGYDDGCKVFRQLKK